MRLPPPPHHPPPPSPPSPSPLQGQLAIGFGAVGVENFGAAGKGKEARVLYWIAS
jgi:hypothetical protein